VNAVLPVDRLAQAIPTLVWGGTAKDLA